MPYPADAPRNKHDLLGPSEMVHPPTSPSDGFMASYSFSTAEEMFNMLQSQVRDPSHFVSTKHAKIESLSAVYSYANAPDPPLSRSLLVVGVANAHQPWVRHLLADDNHNDSHELMHKCTIAVKRLHQSGLAPKDVANSQSFAQFVRSLRKHRQVAVVAPDKYQRFALVSPDDNEETDDDGACYAHLHVGKIDDMQRALAEHSQSAQEAAATSSPRFEPSTPPWQPSTPPVADGSGGGSDNWQPSTPPLPPDDNEAGGDGSELLWQPPGASDTADADGGSGLWQPPTGDNGDTYSYGGSGNDYNDDSNTWNAGEGGGGGAGMKRPRRGSEDYGGNGDDRDDGRRNSSNNQFHTDSGAAAADAFYSGLTRTLDTRADSRIYHMRSFNGWVKATQIQELDPQTFSRGKGRKGGGSEAGVGGKPLRILDLACGKGGDLGKWILHPRGIANYVGIDVARGSLRDAAIRARAPNLRNKLRRCTFTCADLGSDVPGRYASSSSKKKKLQKLLSWSLQDEPPNSTADPEFKEVRGGGISLEDRFDVVSIQFAIHYMMSSRKRARRFFQTVSELLEVGGNLIATTIDARVVVQHLMNLGLDLHFDDDDTTESNKSYRNDENDDALIRVGHGACQIRFPMDKVRRIFSKHVSGDGDDLDGLFGLEYTFTLVEGSEHSRGVGDAVNLPEWLTPLPVLTSLAEEAGLVLEYAHNFHEFYAVRSDPKTHAASHGSLYNMKVLNRNGSIAPDEWEISRLYVAIKFRKVRESTMTLDDEDDIDDDDGDDSDEDNATQEELSSPPVAAPSPDLDPATKAKLLPMAMMKVKRSIGDEKWKSLSSDEKTRLADAELRKLAAAT